MEVAIPFPIQVSFLSASSPSLILSDMMHQVAQSTPLARYLRRKILRHSVHTTLEDLANLLNRVWVERIWTYQEILLASNPVVVCGHRHLHWSRLIWGILFLDASEFDRDNVCALQV
jgi:hypothetical protein